MVNISFGVGGLCGAYHIGVCKKLLEEGILYKFDEFIGASCGAIIALLVALGLDVEHIYMKNIAILKSGSSQELCNIVRSILNEYVPSNGHLLCNGKLKIIVTKLQGISPMYINHFSSREHLIDVVIASCFIPKITSTNLYYNLNGTLILDAGFSDSMPDADIKVSCMPERIIKLLHLHKKKIPKIDISPKEETFKSKYTLVFGSVNYYKELISYGYLDTTEYIIKNKSA